MKTKIIINDEQIEITLTPKQVEAITAQQSLKQWEPKGGECYITSSGYVWEADSDNNCKLFGTEYQTKDQAEKARDAMRPHNRLLAWLSENDDGWVADWEYMSQEKYYIYFDVSLDKYRFGIQYGIWNLSTIYMSEQNAKKLCKLLNSGEVVI